MSIKETLIRAIHNFSRVIGEKPSRVLITQEQARNLDAEMESHSESMGNPLGEREYRQIQRGVPTFLIGVPLVADISKGLVLDARKAQEVEE